jgi:hypothetical protein
MVYQADETVRGPDNVVTQVDLKAKVAVRARHETVNRRFGKFKPVNNTFRNNRTKHVVIFFADAVITQISFENGEPPFQVDY